MLLGFCLCNLELLIIVFFVIDTNFHSVCIVLKKRMVTLVDRLHPSLVKTEFSLSRCVCARDVYVHDFLHLSLFLSCLLLSKFDQDNNHSTSSCLLLRDFFPAYDKNHTHTRAQEKQEKYQEKKLSSIFNDASTCSNRR